MSTITDKNNVKRDMTAEEQAEFDQAVQNQQALLQAEQEAETAKENLKTSAKAKLVAGTPLTEEEANVMIGG